MKVLIATLLASSLLSAFAIGQTGPANLPLALHPENSHYFLFRTKPTVLITSGEHYGAVLNLDFDYVRYLDELQATGLNHTRVWAGTYREIPGSFDISENTLAPKPNRYIAPWARSDTPGYFDGGSKFDLSRWDDAYFKRLKDFMTQASKHGVVVELNLFCPNYNDELWKANPMNAANNVNGIGKVPANEAYTLKHKDLLAVQEAVTRKLVEELKDFDNLYYEICNEPYFGGVTQEWQNRIADVIVETEKNVRHPHLISMNIANGSAKVSKPHPAVSIFNFHYCTPPKAVVENYGLGKVIGENETGFRGTADATYRSEAWDFLLAGGALYNNLDYSFTTGHPDGSAKAPKAPGGGSADLRRQLKVLREFMDSLAFVKMKPDNAVIKGGVPKGLTACALVEPGKQYAIYVKQEVLGTPSNFSDPGKPRPTASAESRQVTLEIELPAGDYRVGWINPVNGKTDAEETLRHEGGKAALKSPAFVEDIALRILAGK